MSLAVDDRRFIARLANLINRSGVLLCISNTGTTLWKNGPDGTMSKIEGLKLEDYNIDRETVQYRALSYPDFFSVLTPSPSAKDKVLRINLTTMGDRIASRITHLDPANDVLGFNLLGLDEATVFDLLSKPIEERPPHYALLAWDKLTDTTIPATMSPRSDESYARNRKIIAARVVGGDGSGSTLYTPLSVECTGTILLSDGAPHPGCALYRDDVSREMAQAVARRSVSYDTMTFDQQCAEVAGLDAQKTRTRTPEP